MDKLGKNRDDQKRSNYGTVLKLIATKQCSSRIELAKATGLTKTAISQITSDMIERGIIKEGEKEIRGDFGRNPVTIFISPQSPIFLGVLIDRKCCSAVLVTMDLQVLDSITIEREFATESELIESVYSVVDTMIKKSGGYPDRSLDGIGVAAIGPVNVSEGVIVNPFYFNGIANVEIRKLLEERYHLPVYFDHDNQSAALAEQLFGKGRGYGDILFVTVDRGVGCGITVQGKKIHSIYGYAPEIGHVSIDHKGKECACGSKGCVELYINSDLIKQKLKYVTGVDTSYREYMKFADDPLVDTILCECADILSVGILNSLNILNSQVIIIGGDCCHWPDKYIDRIEDFINRLKFGNKNIRIPVIKPFFGDKAQLMGAACNAFNWIFEGSQQRVI